MNAPLPTRSQIENVFEFLASFTGSGYDDGGRVVFKTGVTHDGVTVVSEEEVHGLFEQWLRERRDEIIGYMVESDCAVEDPETEMRLDEAGCRRWTDGIAHAGPHEWDLVVDGETKDVFVCPGLLASPRTQIGGAYKEWPPRPSVSSVCSGDPENCPDGVPYERHGAGAGGTLMHMPDDGKVVPGLFDHGVPSDARPKTSTHRNTQVLRDLGHDL